MVKERIKGTHNGGFWLKKFDRCLEHIEVFLIGASILSIALIATVNVLTRNIFGFSIEFAEELSQFFIILVSFVGTAYAARMGRHIRMTALYDQFSPRGKKILMLFITLTTALMLGLLTYYSFKYSLSIQKMNSKTPALGLPLYWVYMLVPIGLCLSSLQYFLAFIQNLRKKEVYLSFTEKEAYLDIQDGHL